MQSMQNGELQGLLERQRKEVESLEDKQRVLTQQLDAITRRESETRQETTQLEKALAITKHDVKEVLKRTYVHTWCLLV